MPKLPLAVDIADAVAKDKDELINIEDKVDQLKNDHPEADATREEIADALQHWSEDAGVDKTGLTTTTSLPTALSELILHIHVSVPE